MVSRIKSIIDNIGGWLLADSTLVVETKIPCMYGGGILRGHEDAVAQGQGLPVDLPELTYNPFAEIDNLQIGTGMGLPLTRRHTACLGGSLIIDTSYHEGCRIVIEMPK